MKKLSLVPSILTFCALASSAANAITPKVVYGEDNRVFVENSSSTLYQTLAESTAVQIKDHKLSLSKDGSFYSVKDEVLSESIMNVCKDERFSDVINAGNCSGFLVGEDLLVTAGHCMQNDFDCENTSWAFNYQYGKVQGDATLAAEQVYKCKKIVNQELSYLSKNDFALVQLDRKVEGREPLKFRSTGKVEKFTPLVIIGHPSGLPTMVADGAYVRANTNDFYFMANLDSFGGNSGSAVFNAKTGEVEGILVRGEKDYYRDEQAGCNRVYKCEDDGCRGESVTRITVIPELAPGMTPQEPQSGFGRVFPFSLVSAQ